MKDPRSEIAKKLAPVQGNYTLRLPGGSIPWPIYLLAMEEYNKNHSQTPQRLAERGGFDWAELIACLRGNYSATESININKDLQRIIKSMVLEENKESS